MDLEKRIAELEARVEKLEALIANISSIVALPDFDSAISCIATSGGTYKACNDIARMIEGDYIPRKYEGTK